MILLSNGGVKLIFYQMGWGAQHSQGESNKCSKPFVTRVQVLLKDLGSFMVFNSQICSLPHFRGSFFSLISDIWLRTKKF